MTSPATNYEQIGTMPNTGRWGWYKDHEGREFQRATSLVKKVETDREALDKWYRRQVAIGMALRDDLVLAVKAIGRPGPGGYTREQKADLNKLSETAFEAAKTTDGGVSGTAVHTLTERVDRGEPVEQVAAGLPATYSLAVRNYAKLIELNDWHVVEIERTVVNDRLNVAGTLDRIYRVDLALLGPGTCQHGHAPHEHDKLTAATGQLGVIGDVKTEGEPWRNGLHIGPQLATYSRAERMWLPEGRYVDMPCVRQDVAIVVHIDKETGHVKPLFVDLTAGWRLAVRAREQANDESIARRKLGVQGGLFAEMPGIKQPKVAETFVEHTMAREYGNPNRPDSPPAPSLATAVLDAARANDVGATMAALHHASAALEVPPVERVTNPIPGDQLTITGDGAPREMVAITGADGNVSWAPAGNRGDALPTAAAATVSGQLDEIDRSAIENVWAATGLDMLAETWRIYTEVCGRTWGGRVAEAADARRRQIECVQRSLHTGGGKCACGWNGAQGFPA